VGHDVLLKGQVGHGIKKVGNHCLKPCRDEKKLINPGWVMLKWFLLPSKTSKGVGTKSDDQHVTS